MTVKPSGLTTHDVASGEKLIDVSIYRISYCSADATFDRVVAFIATNKNETMECHAFLTSKKKIAQAAALTISQAFTIAFEKWESSKTSSGKSCSPSKEKENKNDSCAQLIDLDSSFEESMVANSSSSDSGVFTNGTVTINNGLSSPPPVYGRRNSPPLSNGTKITKGSSSSFMTTHENPSPFDVDLDDSFSRLAESRSCLNNNKTSVTSSESAKIESSPFETNSATGDLTAFEVTTLTTGTKSTTIASVNKTNPFALDSFNSSHFSGNSNGLVLPNNLQSLDIDDQEFNQLFSSTARRSTGFTQESEKDFFAEKDDLFSL